MQVVACGATRLPDIVGRDILGLKWSVPIQSKPGGISCVVQKTQHASRTYLYVPGDQEAKLARAAQRGADALIIDLEDGVAAVDKPKARQVVERWLSSLGGRPGLKIWVRINSFGLEGELVEADLDVAVSPGITGVCLAKCRAVDEVVRLDELISVREARRGLPDGSVRVATLLESATALQSATAIASGPRVDLLQIGEMDLIAELGVTVGPDEVEVMSYRAQVVLAAAAAGINPPVGPISRDFRDLEALRTSTERLKRMGFGSRSAIHPAQVGVINDVFTPTEAEEASARALVERFEAASSAGLGVLVDDAGRMVDEPVVRAARRVLARVEQVKQQGTVA